MIHITFLLAAMAISAGPARVDLAGKVLDAAKKPIPQAAVFIYTARPRVGVGVICPGCYLDCGKKAVTDAAGNFLISGLNRELFFKVLVVAEGFRPQFARNVDPLKGPLDVKLETMPSYLSGRAVLRGRVLDDSGKPVVGAIVSPWGCQQADKRWWGAMEGVDMASVTNLRGEFLITGPSGDLGYDLEVEARGFAKLKVALLPTGKKVHEIRLAAGATVRGRILNNGKPAAGIEVGLAQCSRNAETFLGVHRIATNSDGRFEFDNIHANDEYFVYTTIGDAVRLGGILLPERISVAADGTTTELGDRTLSAAVHHVSGRVMLTDSKPVPPHTRMGLFREEAWDSQQAMLAADGTFSFAGVPEEAVMFGVEIPGYRLASKRNHFQQVRESEVALFVDADKAGLVIYLEPEAGKKGAAKQ